jgi:hypothetical protein
MLIATFTTLTIESLNLWKLPPDPPDPRLDELFPEHRKWLEDVRKIREEAGVWRDLMFRYGVITALVASGVWIVARLPRCPAALHLFWD